MKRISLLVLFQMFFLILCAQRTHVIEPSIMEVSYVVKQEKLPVTFILRVGKTHTAYYAYDKYLSDSLASNPETGTLYLQDLLYKVEHKIPQPECSGMSDYVYQDLSTGHSRTYTSVMSSCYCIEDSLADFDWQDVCDSSMIICGYKCGMAKTHFRGRDWKVWYSVDIPVSTGPWKFNGLPGLVMKAECDGFMSIEANAIRSDNLSPVTFYNFFESKYSSLPREKCLKMKNNKNLYPAKTRFLPPMELE